MSDIKVKADFPSDDDLAAAANEVLLASDPYTISAKQIRLQLEEKFGCELTAKKDLLRTIIENFLADRQSESEQEDEEPEVVSSGKAKKAGKGFGSVMYTSQLADFMQKDSGSRTEVSQVIWKYIREHNLQNPQDRREIVCDEKLTALFKRKTINMLKMTKALSQMMKTTNGMVDQSQSRSKRSSDEVDDQGSDADDASEEKSKPSKKKARKESDESKSGKGKKKENAFQRVVHFSSRLATFMKAPSGPRTAVTKAVWDYIKLHQLQNPQDKREILCDEALESLLGKKKVNMFSMTKVLSKMMHSAEAEESGEGSGDEMDQDEEEPKPSKKAVSKSKDKKKKSSSTRSGGEKKEGNKARTGFAAEVSFSPQLASFMGAPSAPRTDITKKIWAYIKEQGLQDPADKRQILCDAKLKALLGVNKVHMFTMNKLLQPMILPLNGVKGEEVVSADGRGKPFDIYKVKKYDWKRVVKLSHRLREFIGTKYALKSAVQKRFRDYIEKHKLYSKKHNIKRIVCDEALRRVFKRRKFDRFMLNEFLDKHMTKMKVRATRRRKKKLDGDRQLTAEQPFFLRIEEYVPSEMRQSNARESLQADLNKVFLLSPRLQQVVGLATATVQEATLGLLRYAKRHSLLRGYSTGIQYLRCDEALQELFDGADKVKFKKIRQMILNEVRPVGNYLIDQSIERDGINAPAQDEESPFKIKKEIPELEAVLLQKDEEKKTKKKKPKQNFSVTVINKKVYRATPEGRTVVRFRKEKLRKQLSAKKLPREFSDKVKRKRLIQSLVS